MLVYYAYNPHLVDKPPVIPIIDIHLRMWRNINNSFKNVRGTPESLIRRITCGHPYTASHNGYRHSSRFLIGQVVSLDFDDGGMSLQDLARDEFIANNAYFLYTTPSHTDAHPRSRVVFLLPTPVREASVFSLIAQALVLKYNTSDQSCKDPARIFFGSRGAEVIRLRRWLDVSKLDKEFNIISASRKRRVSTIETKISDETIDRNVRRKLDEIMQAPDGARHSTRLSVSMVFGGWVAAGYLSRSEATQLLVEASMANTSSDIKLIEHDVESGLDYGIQRPLSMRKITISDWGINLGEL